MTRRAGIPCPTEYEEQKIVAEYLRRRGLLFTATLGGVRVPIGCAVKLKAQGYQAGVPDLLIFTNRVGKFTGVAIEMKRRKGGVVSAKQSTWMERLASQGWATFVAHGAAQAIAEIQHYYPTATK